MPETPSKRFRRGDTKIIGVNLEIWGTGFGKSADSFINKINWWGEDMGENKFQKFLSFEKMGRNSGKQWKPLNFNTVTERNDGYSCLL